MKYVLPELLTAALLALALTTLLLLVCAYGG